MRVTLLLSLLAFSFCAIAQERQASYTYTQPLTNGGNNKAYTVNKEQNEPPFLRFQKQAYLRFVRPLEADRENDHSLILFNKATFSSVPNAQALKNTSRLSFPSFTYTKPSPMLQAFMGTLDVASQIFLNSIR